MPDFSELFDENNWEPINYKGKRVVLSDKFPVNNGDILIASIEKASGKDRQGFCIDITGIL